MTSDLVDFLLARIDEDEEDAQRLQAVYDSEVFAAPGWLVNARGMVDPGRVLAECDAKRQLIESIEAATGGDKTYGQRMRHTDTEDAYYVIVRDMLRFLALPYAGHEDYRDEWRP